jgi:hypothetical protein
VAHPALPDVWAVSMTTDAAALIRAGKPRTLTYAVCVDPDLVGEYERALAEQARAKEGARDSLGAGAMPAGLEERIAGLLEQIEANTVTLVFRTLPRPQFKALRDQYPPRRNDDGAIDPQHLNDARLGVNNDEFWEPLIRASLVSPELDDETMRVLVEELLTDGQWSELSTKVWNLNESTVSVPFSPAASTTNANSSPRSKRRNGSASR